VPLCHALLSTHTLLFYLRYHRLKIFHSTTITSREFSRIFNFDNYHTHKKKTITSPFPTITRRIGKLPRSPIPQSMPQSIFQSNEQFTKPPTDTPHDTDEDTYDNEHTTLIPIRKRPSADTRIPKPSRASSPLLMDVLMAQNMQTMKLKR
jgi:hypothetical protein